jgi:hypothetical protein
MSPWITASYGTKAKWTDSWLHWRREVGYLIKDWRLSRHPFLVHGVSRTLGWVGNLGLVPVRQPRMSIRRTVYVFWYHGGLCTVTRKKYTPSGEYPARYGQWRKNIIVCHINLYTVCMSFTPLDMPRTHVHDLDTSPELNAQSSLTGGGGYPI